MKQNTSLLTLLLVSCNLLAAYSPIANYPPDNTTSTEKTPKPASDFDKGVSAYQKKDYTTALMLWFPLAEKGDAEVNN